MFQVFLIPINKYQQSVERQFNNRSYFDLQEAFTEQDTIYQALLFNMAVKSTLICYSPPLTSRITRKTFIM